MVVEGPAEFYARAKSDFMKAFIFDHHPIEEAAELYFATLSASRSNVLLNKHDDQIAAFMADILLREEVSAPAAGKQWFRGEDKRIQIAPRERRERIGGGAQGSGWHSSGTAPPRRSAVPLKEVLHRDDWGGASPQAAAILAKKAMSARPSRGDMTSDSTTMGTESTKLARYHQLERINLFRGASERGYPGQLMKMIYLYGGGGRNAQRVDELMDQWEREHQRHGHNAIIGNWTKPEHDEGASFHGLYTLGFNAWRKRYRDRFGKEPDERMAHQQYLQHQIYRNEGVPHDTLFSNVYDNEGNMNLTPESVKTIMSKRVESDQLGLLGDILGLEHLEPEERADIFAHMVDNPRNVDIPHLGQHGRGYLARRAAHAFGALHQHMTNGPSKVGTQLPPRYSGIEPDNIKVSANNVEHDSWEDALRRLKNEDNESLYDQVIRSVADAQGLSEEERQVLNFPSYKDKQHTVDHDEAVDINHEILSQLRNHGHLTDEQHEQVFDLARGLSSNANRHQSAHDAMGPHHSPLMPLRDWNPADGVPIDALKSFAAYAHLPFEDEGGYARDPLSLLYDLHEMFPGMFTQFSDQLQFGGMPDIPDDYKPGQQRQKDAVHEMWDMANQRGEAPLITEDERVSFPPKPREGRARSDIEARRDLAGYGRALGMGSDVQDDTRAEHAWSNIGDVDLQVLPGLEWFLGSLKPQYYQREEGGILSLNRSGRLGSHIDTPVPGTTLIRNKIKSMQEGDMTEGKGKGGPRQRGGSKHTGLGGHTWKELGDTQYGAKLSREPSADLIRQYQQDLMLTSHIGGLHHAFTDDMTEEQVNALLDDPTLLFQEAEALKHTFDMFGRGKSGAHMDELGFADTDPEERMYGLYDFEQLQDLLQRHNHGELLDPRKALVSTHNDVHSLTQQLFSATDQLGALGVPFQELWENAIRSGNQQMINHLSGVIRSLEPGEITSSGMQDQFHIWRSKKDLDEGKITQGSDTFLRRLLNTRTHESNKGDGTQYVIGPPPEDLTEMALQQIQHDIRGTKFVEDVSGLEESGHEIPFALRRDILDESLRAQQEIHNAITGEIDQRHQSVREITNKRKREQAMGRKDSFNAAITMAKGIMAHITHRTNQDNEDGEAHPLNGLFDAEENNNRAYCNTAMAFKQGMQMAHTMSQADRARWAQSLLDKGCIDQSLADEISNLKTSSRTRSTFNPQGQPINGFDAWFDEQQEPTGKDVLRALVSGELGSLPSAGAQHSLTRLLDSVDAAAKESGQDPSLHFMSRYLPHSSHYLGTDTAGGIVKLPHPEIQDVSSRAYGSQGMRFNRKIGTFPEHVEDKKGVKHLLLHGGESLGWNMGQELKALTAGLNIVNEVLGHHGKALSGKRPHGARTRSLLIDPSEAKRKAGKLRGIRAIMQALHEPIGTQLSTRGLEHIDEEHDKDSMTNLQRGTLADVAGGANSRMLGAFGYPEFEYEHRGLDMPSVLDRKNTMFGDTSSNPVQLPKSVALLRRINPTLQPFDEDANIQERWFDLDSGQAGMLPGAEHNTSIPMAEYQQLTGGNTGEGIIQRSALAYLTGADDLLKEDEERDKGTPPPIKAMHRIFDLEDLKHLRGFTGDWLVTSWPKNGTRVIVTKEGDKVTHYDSEGHGIGLPRDVIQGVREAASVDFIIDGVWDGKRLQVVDMIKVADDESQHDHLKDRVRHLRANFESTDAVAMPAPINTRRADDEGLEAAVQELLEEPDVEQIMLRDAESTYMLGERRHPKWVLYTPSKEVDVIILGRRKGTYRLGVGPIDSSHANKIGNRGAEYRGQSYMEVGTVESKERYSVGDHITVEVSGVTHQTRDDEDVFTLQTLSVLGESETEAADSVETLCVLACDEQENVPHTVKIEKSRLLVSFPALGEDVIYKINQWLDAWATTMPYTTDFSEGEYYVRLAESQRPFWSPLAALMLKGYIACDDDDEPTHVEEEPVANHKKKPKKVDEDQFFKDPEVTKSVSVALHLIERVMKEKMTWTGPKGFGLDYATGDVESPRGPTELTRPSTLPDFAPADRDGEEPEEDILDEDSRKRKKEKITTDEGEQGVLDVDEDNATLVIPKERLDIS